MANILYDTWKQIKAIEMTPPIHTFLNDTFTQNEGAVMAEDARYDYYKGTVPMAPFVVPGAGGKNMPREKFQTRAIGFPTIAPERTINYDEYASQRMFGEAIGGGLDPNTRLAKLKAQDMAFLRNTIAMREEWMAAQALFTGKLDIFEYLEGGQVVKATRAADFDFTNHYAPTKKWNESGANIYEDFMQMIDMVSEGNGSPDIAIFGLDVRSAILQDEKMLKMLDVRNGFYGRIEPDKPNYQKATQYVGTLSTGTELYCYTGKYRETAGGAEQTLIPKGKMLLGGGKLLRKFYGPVAQVEKEGEDPKVYAAAQVPFRYSKAGSDSAMQRLTSRPMLVPYNVDAWAVGTVL